MSDLRPLSASVSKLTSEAFTRKFVALGRILTQWDDIVGPEMADKTQPAKIHYRKPKVKGEKPQATLDIAASSADAALLHYQKELILERINQLYGDRWITSIRFVHIATNSGKDEGLYTFNRSKPQLTPEDQQRVEEMIGEIDDEDIRNRLEKLGQSVLRKERQKPS